jgi:myo-inositol-1(or 4)-monophosphatase
LLVTDSGAARLQDSTRLAAAVREAGALALKTFGKPLKSWTKHGDSPVTEADIAVDELLHARLADAAGGYGWLSEESENDPTRLTKRRVWVIDPIEGTRAYIAGRADWSISAALVEDGRPTVAVVLVPVSDEIFTAVLGKGATRNSAPIAASTGAGIDGARFAGPRRVLESIATRNPGLVAIPRIFSLALRLARLAQGEIDAAIAGGNGCDWDLAAADLLVHEAGGMLTSLDGKPLIYNQPNPVHGVLVAAGRERHPALLDLVRAQHNSPA